MKILLSIVLLSLSIFSTRLYSKEIISVVIGASPSQSSVSLQLKIFETANQIQNQYWFRAVFKPGAQGVIAVRYMDQSPHDRIASIAPSFVENSRAGLINEHDYRVVNALGDSCWALITNVGDSGRGISSLADIRGQEILVGGTGFGNAAHLTSLILAERYGFKIRYVVYRSNYDALIQMVADNSINFVLERVSSYQQLRDKNVRLQILGINCMERNQSMPEVATLREQGVDTPMIFFSQIANKSMDETRRKEIGEILDRAQALIGKKEMIRLADILAPQFQNISTEDWFQSRISVMKNLVTKYQSHISGSANK
jgi:tripartite-type tricarboxylate transporter receptor subunit TctC